MGVDDIAPDHRALAVSAREFAQLTDVFEIQSSRSQLIAPRLALALSEVKGFIAVRVHQR